MSVAVIQGSSTGLGLALAQHILRKTNLKVYALTHQKSQQEVERRISAGGDGFGERLTVISGVDVREEGGLEKAAGTVQEREGKGSVRLVACLAGVVSRPCHSMQS
jgi:NAD(P)-dependent dehydrogenase (short-subunit alcohol dehydrogenase family)